MNKLPLFRTLILPFALFGLAVATPAAAQTCLSDAEVQSYVSTGQIQPVASVLAREGISPSTQVLSVRVCDSGGQLSYYLAVLDETGQARNLTLSAR